MRALLLLSLAVFSSCSCGPTPCVDGDPACTPMTLVGVTVSDPTARGCEVLLTEQPGTRVERGTFTQGVVGTSLREAPRVALTFVVSGDTAFPNGSVQLALSAGALSGVTVTQATCVDLAGARLPNATVSLR